jgi:uncharacterized protein (DUF433 family)
MKIKYLLNETIIRMYKQGFVDAEIAEDLGLEVEFVAMVIDEEGIRSAGRI